MKGRRLRKGTRGLEDRDNNERLENIGKDVGDGMVASAPNQMRACSFRPLPTENGSQLTGVTPPGNDSDPQKKVSLRLTYASFYPGPNHPFSPNIVWELPHISGLVEQNPPLHGWRWD